MSHDWLWNDRYVTSSRGFRVVKADAASPFQSLVAINSRTHVLPFPRTTGVNTNTAAWVGNLAYKHKTPKRPDHISYTSRHSEHLSDNAELSLSTIGFNPGFWPWGNDQCIRGAVFVVPLIMHEIDHHKCTGGSDKEVLRCFIAGFTHSTSVHGPSTQRPSSLFSFFHSVVLPVLLLALEIPLFEGRL